MTRDEIADLLPEVYRRGMIPGTPLFALLSAMEALLQPREMMLSALPDAFRPDRASAPFVRLLGGGASSGSISGSMVLKLLL
jgi:hypothetical protein